MSTTDSQPPGNAPAEAAADAAGSWSFLAVGGQMGKLIRATDWGKTPLGPIESWPQILRTTVGLCVATKFPISVAWGSSHCTLYNDSYLPICGAKHPKSLGQDYSELWEAAWPWLGEAFA